MKTWSGDEPTKSVRRRMADRALWFARNMTFGVGGIASPTLLIPLWGRPYMTSAKFLGFWTPPPLSAFGTDLQY